MGKLNDARTYARVMNAVIEEIESRPIGEFTRDMVFDSMRTVKGKGGLVYAYTGSVLEHLVQIGELEKCNESYRVAK